MVWGVVFPLKKKFFWELTDGGCVTKKMKKQLIALGFIVLFIGTSLMSSVGGIETDVQQKPMKKISEEKGYGILCLRAKGSLRAHNFILKLSAKMWWHLEQDGILHFIAAEILSAILNTIGIPLAMWISYFYISMNSRGFSYPSELDCHCDNWCRNDFPDIPDDTWYGPDCQICA